MSLCQFFLNRTELISGDSTTSNSEKVFELLNGLVGEDLLSVFSTVAMGNHNLLDAALIIAENWVTDIPQFPVNLEQTIHFLIITNTN